MEESKIYNDVELYSYIYSLKLQGYRGNYYIFYNKLEKKYYSYSEYIEKQNPQLYKNVDLDFICLVEIIDDYY